MRFTVTRSSDMRSVTACSPVMVLADGTLLAFWRFAARVIGGWRRRLSWARISSSILLRGSGCTRTYLPTPLYSTRRYPAYLSPSCPATFFCERRALVMYSRTDSLAGSRQHGPCVPTSVWVQPRMACSGRWFLLPNIRLRQCSGLRGAGAYLALPFSLRCLKPFCACARFSWLCIHAPCAAPPAATYIAPPFML